MRIEFSKHCLDQLKIRTRISKQMVLETVESPNEVSESFKGRKLYRKEIEKDTLEVVAVEDDNKLVIITAYILESEQ